MFLEYWMIAVLMVIWIAGMLHMQRVGQTEGYGRGFQMGNYNGVHATLSTLEKFGYLDEQMFKEINQKIVEDARKKV